MYFPPYPIMMTNLQPWIVQSVTAFEGNLIMMNLEMDIFIKMFDFIMTNLQMARERVSQMATVWIIKVKLVWNSMKIPQGSEY